jgi:hypothetical protein
MTDALNAETGVRGYGATGDRFFLAPYHVATAKRTAELVAGHREAIRQSLD